MRECDQHQRRVSDFWWSWCVPNRGSHLSSSRSESLKTHPGYPAYGGYYREEAILMLRRFYLNQNVNAPKPRVKSSRVLKTEFLPIPVSSVSRSGTPTPTQVGRPATPRTDSEVEQKINSLVNSAVEKSVSDRSISISMWREIEKDILSVQAREEGKQDLAS
jgi:hypothetical protein